MKATALDLNVKNQQWPEPEQKVKDWLLDQDKVKFMDKWQSLTDSEVRGLLRIDVHGPMARSFIIPELPTFLACHPALTVFIGEGDRFVDIVREGFDCVIRLGEPADSDMIVRRLGLARKATLASPAYLERHGIPQSLDDLEGHAMIGFASSRTGQVLPLEFTVRGEVRSVALPARVTVNGSDTYGALARLGFGPSWLWPDTGAAPCLRQRPRIR